MLFCILQSFCFVLWSPGAIAVGDWVKSPPPKCLNVADSEKHRVPGEDIYEVVNSKFHAANYYLGNEIIQEYTEIRAKYLLGDWYKLSKEKKPYLVRAVYGESKGQFNAWWCEGDLVISHSAVAPSGASIKDNKTALIINLKRTPSTVYAEAVR